MVNHVKNLYYIFTIVRHVVNFDENLHYENTIFHFVHNY